ncbi:GntR family transcriptional regulator [Sporanaerobium hydrogeniformans]|uniref:GntR family transcriptional regulator n=1 Tax=Sporanaerobium hydrogeniformans TaxID=3072179 RepID=A0AC61DBJ8_9FIRM|nr:GntR family transcriptional regulator [Sporanaerobium hydrogeniformans]PHV70605.1 GntR family transcriptional regulator [Sporanaerobium hydrogeniformans]
MAWQFDNSKPIYIQLVEALKLQIISGTIPIGSKLISVRDMAEEAGVNPNTMQRALAELERENLVFSQRTTGRFVTEDENLVKELRRTFAMEKINELTTTLLQMGYSKNELIELIHSYLNKEE